MRSTRSEIKASLEDSARISRVDQHQIALLMQDVFHTQRPTQDIFPHMASRFNRMAVLREAGQICGCMGVGTIETAHERIVLIGSLAIRPYARGGADVYSFAVRVLMEQWLALPHKRVYALGATFNPFAYSAIVRRVGMIYPTPRHPVIPRELHSIAVAGLRVDAKLPDREFDPSSGVGRGAMGFIPRFDREVNLEDPLARFFVDRNPNYAAGDVLLMVAPMSIDNILATVRNITREALRRSVKRTTARFTVPSIPAAA